MKTPCHYFKGLFMVILFSLLAGQSIVNAQTTLPDSLVFKGAKLDIGEKFRTGYYTSFYHYAINSYFKEPNGNEHLAYVDNYKLYYFKSTDDGINWTKEQIITAKEGDIFSCALTVDTVGKVFIGITVNNNFNYSNPTAIGAGSEFYYDLYSVNNKTGSWVTELVNTHSAGNFGPRVTGLFVDKGNNVHMIANYYGWQSNGGTAWEWIRNATSNTWGTTITIVKFTDTPIDRSIFDTYSIAPDQKGNVTIVMCRETTSTTVSKPRLFYVRHNGSSWLAPVAITDSIAVAWNRFDALVDPAGHTYIAFLKKNKTGVPELKIAKDFQPAQTPLLNLAAGDTLNYFRMHCNAKGLFTMYLYLNTKYQKIKISFSKDAVKWTNPIPTPTDLNDYLGGMIVKTDTRRGYFTDYCKQIISKAGPRTAQPYGPDELFYGSIKLLETPVAGNAELLSSGIIVKQNYPNPFSETTTISWHLPNDAHVVLKVYDFIGCELKTLVDGEQAKGEHNVIYDATGLPGGVYFYTLQAGNFIKTQKMILMK